MRSPTRSFTAFHWLWTVAAIALISGCSGTKELTEPVPDWVQQRPQIPGYYIGVASASKLQFPADASERAQRQALAELAGQIRVSIDSKSVLHSTQFQGIAGQSFSETITSSSAEDLEGYERVGYYENESDAWTYYRLSQSTHERIRKERKTAALELAGDYWVAAQEAMAQGEVQQALDRFIRSLESMEKHWGEINLWKSPDGETIALDRACLDGIGGLIGGLRLNGQTPEITLAFQQRYTGSARCQVQYNGMAIAGMPIKWNYNRGTLPRTVQLTTGENGWSEMLLEGFEAGLQRSELTATIALDELMPTLRDSKVSNLLGSLLEPQQTWPILLPPPTIFIESKELIDGKPSNQDKLRNALAQGLNDAGIQWVNTAQQADLLLSMESDTRRAGSGNGFYTAMLDASIVLTTSEGASVLQRNLQSVKGVQLNWAAAHGEAYRKAQIELQRTFIQELLKSLYQ